MRSNTSDTQVLRNVLEDRQYDISRFQQYAAVQDIYLRMIRAGVTPLIIDLGANIGASVLWFSSLYPLARIVAVEPDATNVDLCRLNTTGRNVDIVEAAIGSEPGYVSVIDHGGEKWAVTTERDESGTTPVCTIDGILNDHPDAELFIVKIDIEGFEADLFAANTDWVEHAKVVFIEPHDWLLPSLASSRTFQHVFGNLDFDLLMQDENIIYVRRDPKTPQA